jgi:hypothetical protein
MTQRELIPLYTHSKRDRWPNNLFPTVNEIVQSDKELMKQCLNGFVSEKDISKLDNLKNGTFIRYAVKNDDGTIRFRMGGTIYRKHQKYITLVSARGKFWHVSKRKMVIFWRRKMRKEVVDSVPEDTIGEKSEKSEGSDNEPEDL